MTNLKFRQAKNEDTKGWLELLALVKDNFPGLDIEEYKINLNNCILNNNAIVALSSKKIVGVLAFQNNPTEISFLAVHPDYRRLGIAQNLIKLLRENTPNCENISVTTYREGDPLGISARKLYFQTGFKEGKFIEIFNYPCQEFVYSKSKKN